MTHLADIRSILLCWIGIVLSLASTAQAEDIYFHGSLQGTKYDFSLREGDIDPASPERGYVEISITTVRALDVILVTRMGLQPDADNPPRTKGRRINASPGAPRKERFTLYLDEIGLESPGEGLIGMLLRFPLSQFDQNLIARYRSDGSRVILSELSPLY